MTRFALCCQLMGVCYLLASPVISQLPNLKVHDLTCLVLLTNGIMLPVNESCYLSHSTSLYIHHLSCFLLETNGCLSRCCVVLCCVMLTSPVVSQSPSLYVHDLTCLVLSTNRFLLPVDKSCRLSQSSNLCVHNLTLSVVESLQGFIHR